MSEALKQIMADRELSRAITALYLEVDESIVNDIRSKADAATQTLRDERERLREALVKCRRELWHCNEQLKYKGATEGFSVTEALSEAKAALTPVGGEAND